MGPIQTLRKQFNTYFQNLGLAESKFEAPKFLHKCEAFLWVTVNWQFTIDLYGFQHLHRNLDPSNLGSIKHRF